MYFLLGYEFTLVRGRNRIICKCNNLAKDAKKNNRIVCKHVQTMFWVAHTFCYDKSRGVTGIREMGHSGSTYHVLLSWCVIAKDRSSWVLSALLCSGANMKSTRRRKSRGRPGMSRTLSMALLFGAYKFPLAPCSYGSHRSYGLTWLELHVADLCSAVSETSMISWLPVHMSIQV